MYIILISVSFIILSFSLEAMMRVKDISLFNIWFESQSGVERDAAFSVYVTALLSVYFQSVIAPIVFGVHTYFAYMKIRINKLFVFMWTVLLGGGLAYVVAGMQLGSIFFYLNIIIYMILIVTTLSLLSVINQTKGL